jgi:hypothetical protein
LRDEPSVVDGPRPPVERELFAAAPPLPAHDVRPASGATLGISTWTVAALSLVVGILIGFASGFSAGQRTNGTVASAPAAPEPVATSDNEAGSPAGRDFTEGAVGEPVRVAPPPIVESREVPAPDRTPPAPPPAAPRERGPEPSPAERPGTERPRTTRPAAAPPVASGPGSLQIVSRPAGAQVVLDGRVIGRTPLMVPDVGSGRHDVRLELTDFRPWATSVEVTPGRRTRVAASLEQ